MRTRGRSVPNFQRLDTHVSESQAFVNTRDLQVARKNHNVLLARRTKRSVLQLTTVYGSNADFTTIPVRSASFFSGRATSLAFVMTVIEQLVMVSQQTRTLRLFVRATKNNAAGGFSPVLMPRLRPLHVNRDNDSVERITVTAAAGPPASYSCNVSVPHNFDRSQTYYCGYNAFVFSLQCLCSIETEATATVGLSDVGPNWVEPSAAGLSAGTAYSRTFVFSDTAIDSRTCVRYSGGIGPHGRYYVDRPFTRYPTVFDTVSEWAVIGVTLYSLSLFEKPVSDYALVSGDA